MLMLAVSDGGNIGKLIFWVVVAIIWGVMRLVKNSGGGADSSTPPIGGPFGEWLEQLTGETTARPPSATETQPVVRVRAKPLPSRLPASPPPMAASRNTSTGKPVTPVEHHDSDIAPLEAAQTIEMVMSQARKNTRMTSPLTSSALSARIFTTQPRATISPDPRLAVLRNKPSLQSACLQRFVLGPPKAFERDWVYTSQC